MKMRVLLVLLQVVVPSVLLAQYLPLTGGTLSGPLTAPSINAVLNPASCGDSTPPSWCRGTDIGAYVNAAIAACAGNQNLIGNCDIYLPPGAYTISSTININRVGVHLHGGGRGGVTELDYSGAGDVITMNPLLGSGSGGFNPVQGGPTVSDLRIVAADASASSAIHMVNCNDCKIEDVEAWSSPNCSNRCVFNAGFWIDDQLTSSGLKGWSERNTFIRAYSYENKNGFLFTNNGGSGSFARTHCFSCFVNVGNQQTAITAAAAAVYDSFLDISGNLDNGTSGGVVLYADGTSIFGFGNEYKIKFENNQQTGTATCISAPIAGARITGQGWIECINSASFPMVNSINPNAHLGLAGSRDPLQSEFNFGIVPWLVPQNPNALEGIGFNMRWDNSNWRTNGDNSSNGGAFIGDNNGSGDIEVYSIPSTAGGNQTVSQSTFGNHLVATFNSGGLSVRGNISATGSKSFRIDHPLDPANKYLIHNAVESPDLMNIYNGSVTTDKHGLAVVVLPEYFQALNRDFRYQLTAIGQFAQAIVANKIVNNRFVIRTNKPGVEVSWQVTGIRHDVYANVYRTPTEQIKPPSEQGHYLQPELFGVPQEQTIGYLETNSYRATSHTAPNEPISSSETMSVAREPR